jgi:hypothetical protein
MYFVIVRNWDVCGFYSVAFAQLRLFFAKNPGVFAMVSRISQRGCGGVSWVNVADCDV